VKIAILGDTHFGARSDNLAFHQHMRKFYVDFFFPKLKELDINRAVQLGDLFDRRKFINFNTLFQCRDYFFNVARDEGIQFDVFPGNHDTFYKTTNEINSLQLLLGEYENFNVVDEPSEIDYDGVPIALIPWICPENEKRCLDFIANTKAQILMGHLELAGFEMYKGSYCEHGYDMKIFNKFDMVFSGHYHHKSSRGNIYYLGTPYELTWSDWNDPKGFHVFDTETRELTFVENPFKMFQKIHYDDSSEEFDYVVNVDLEHLKDSIVKVIVHNKNNPFWFDKFIERIEKTGVVDLQIVDDNLYLDLEEDADLAEGIEDTLSVLQKYTDQITHVDSKQLFTVMVDIYNEAMLNNEI
jgi:DNA repair exonuclease SbcCD nuclease subunit